VRAAIASSPFTTPQVLLAHDASVVAAMDEIDRTPLHLAAQHGHLACLSALLAAGAPVHPPADSAVTSAVHAAAAANHLACLQTLLEAGGRSTAQLRDSFGRTPLHVAAAAGHAACVEVRGGQGRGRG